MSRLDELVNRFLMWKLPASVCSDVCATKPGGPHAHLRTGTNLLNADEARQMIEYLGVADRQEITGKVGPIEFATSTLRKVDISDGAVERGCIAMHAFAFKFAEDNGAPPPPTWIELPAEVQEQGRILVKAVLQGAFPS